MTKSTLITILLGLTGFGTAQTKAASLPFPGTPLSFSLKETYTDSTVTVREGVKSITSLVSKNSTNISLSIALGQFNDETFEIDALDLSTITAETPFRVTVGGLTWEGTLADDPDIAKNLPRRFAFIPANLNEDGKAKGASGIKLAWTSTKLTVTIVTALNDEENVGSAYIGTLVGDAEPGGPALITRDQLPISYTFGPITNEEGGFSGFEDLKGFALGTAKVSTKKVGGEDFELNSIAVTASLDRTAPKVTITVPKGGYQPVNGSVTVRGKITDGHGIKLREWLTNIDYESKDITNFTVVKGPPAGANEGWWGPTELDWEITIPNLVNGVNELEIYITDVGGNVAYASTRVILPLPQVYQGRWDALFNTETGAPGHLYIITTPGGAITGKLSLNGIAEGKSVVGSWTEDGFVGYIDQNKPSELRITGLISEETLEADLNSIRLDVSVSDYVSPENLATGQGFRTPYSKTNKIAADSKLLGQFNVQVASSPEYAIMGNSYFSIVTADVGTTKIAGKLADGTTITGAGAIGAAGQVPVFISLYKNKGCFQTLQTINSADGTLTNTTADWHRNDSWAFYELNLSTGGASYSPPAKDTRILGLSTDNAEARWIGDGANEVVNQSILISTANVISPVNNPSFKGKIDVKNGLVQGSFKLDTTPASTASYSGIIIGDRVYGHYIAPAPKGTFTSLFGEFSIGFSK